MVVHPYNIAQNSQGQKVFHKRFIPETPKSTQLVNHRQQSTHSTWLLFSQNYDRSN